MALSCGGFLRRFLWLGFCLRRTAYAEEGAKPLPKTGRRTVLNDDRRRLRLGFRHRDGCRGDKLADSRLLRLLFLLVGFAIQYLGNVFTTRLDEFVAVLSHVLHLVATDALNLEMRVIHARHGQEQHTDSRASFDGGDIHALFVQQIGCDGDRQLRLHARGLFLHGLFFDQAKYRQGRGVDGANLTLAFAAGAFALGVVDQGRAQTLTRHLQQTKSRDLADLDAGAVVAHGATQSVLNFALILVGPHVDEVDNDQAAKVTQLELAGDLIGCFEVGVKGRFLDARAACGPRRVDVDGRQGFGVVDDNRATRRQAHFTLVGRFDLAFDLVAREQRNTIVVELQLAQVLRHDRLHEFLGLGVQLGIVDQDFIDIRAQVVTQRTDNDAGFLVDQMWSLDFA